MEDNINLIQINDKGEEVLFYHYDAQKKEFIYYSRKLQNVVAVPLAEMHLGLRKEGNAKTGKEWLLNTLPGEHPMMVKGMAVTNLAGSCVGCCDGCEPHCYAIKGAKQHHNTVVPSNGINLILYREDRNRFLNELRHELSSWRARKEKVFRWHAAGEIESPQYLEDMMTIATEYPDIHFYSYTKRFKWIEKYLDTHEGKFPSNFTWNLSVWKNNLQQSGFPNEYLKEVQLFVWDDGEDPNISSMVHCPSVEWPEGKNKGRLNHDPFPNGKKRNCRNCGLCWKGNMKGKTIAVYNH